MRFGGMITAGSTIKGARIYNLNPQGEGVFAGLGPNNNGIGVGANWYFKRGDKQLNYGSTLFDNPAGIAYEIVMNWNTGTIFVRAGDRTQQRTYDLGVGYTHDLPEIAIGKQNTVNGNQAWGTVYESSNGQLAYAQYWYEEGTLTRDFVPVLDANDTPCLYDKVTRQCFYNQGTGTFGYRIKTNESESSTFSLRDPYYTAPSGVWAKLIAENTLDIIADTDMQDGEEQGYTWFANTGEAYEHFGIKPEELLTNETTND